MKHDYDQRYVDGIRLFNEREFFECHDVLEDLWNDVLGPERTFYQGLIHASVSCFHFENSNLGGARKMFGSCRDYLSPYAPQFMGLDVEVFLAELSLCFKELRTAESGQYPAGVELDPLLIPTISIAESA